MLRITETQFDKLSGWRPQPMTMPLEAIPHCPCCLGAIQAVAGIYTPLAVVVVCECPSCGWLGYGNRPSAQWFESFYASDWDEAGQGATIDLSKCAVHPITLFTQQLVRIGEQSPTVCDIGCGFGVAVWQLNKLGYIAGGVEKCSHRRRNAIAQGLWCEESLSDYSGQKFDVITAHHVLEHCLDPDAFVKEIAEHQDEGGIMYLSVPNQVGEPSMGCLLFLPHLHSFTFASLCRLAQRHGYSLQAYDVVGFNIQAAFKKQLGPTYISVPETAAAKLSRAVHANGQGELLSWCGNLSDAWFTTADRFSGWAKDKWKPRALAAKRERSKGRFPVELEVPCLFVK